MRHVFITRQARCPVSDRAITSIVRVAARYEKKIHGMVGITLVGEKAMRRLNREHRGVDRSTDVLSFPWHDGSVKDRFPNLFLIANLGAAQLTKANAVDLCRQAVDMIQADAFAIHLNVVQECVQEEGDRKFKGLLDQIHRITDALTVPVIVKEVGCGIAPFTAKKLVAAGVKALDVGGRGRTSWPYIERLRSSSEKVKQLADSFRN